MPQRDTYPNMWVTRRSGGSYTRPKGLEEP